MLENNSYHKERILIVDDEPPILEIIHSVLTSEGYLVDSVQDALEALSYLAEKHYDLVLSDVMMPDMGGLELLQKISLLYPQTITIMLTGYANIKDAVAAIKLGAFDYIAKPVYPEALVLTIARALQFKAYREAAAELEWTLQGAEALGLQLLDLSPEIEEFQVLDTLRQQALEIDDQYQLAQLFLFRAQDLTQATRGSLFLYDQEGTTLHCMALTDDQFPDFAQKVLPGGEGVMEYVIQNRRPVLVRDVTMEPRYFQLKVSQRYATGSFMVVPIMAGKLWGVINLADRQDLKPFSPRELLLIWLLARILAETLQYKDREERDRSINQALLATQIELEEIRSYIGQLSASVSMGLAVLDNDLRIVSVNPAFEEFVGQRNQKLIGRDIFTVIKQSAGGETKKLRQCFAKVLQGEPLVKCGQISLASQRGDAVAEVRLVAIQSSSGTTQLMLMLEDITKIANMQQRVAFYEHLAIMGKLTASVVHELNNPLDGVKRYISLALMKKDQGGEVERYLNEAQKGLSKMSQAINSMLSVANPNRMLKGKESLANQLQEAVKIMIFQANDQSVEIALSIAPVFEQVLFGSDVYTVFVNLIKNALQAMPHGGKLHIIGREHPGGLTIQFSDTGAGIPPEDLEGIFKPFFTTKTQGQGLGLGLPISQKILEKYQGKINVESIMNQGSTFTIELPWPQAYR